jgi:hypothetical protein
MVPYSGWNSLLLTQSGFRLRAGDGGGSTAPSVNTWGPERRTGRSNTAKNGWIVSRSLARQ